MQDLLTQFVQDPSFQGQLKRHDARSEKVTALTTTRANGRYQSNANDRIVGDLQSIASQPAPAPVGVPTDAITQAANTATTPGNRAATTASLIAEDKVNRNQPGYQAPEKLGDRFFAAAGAALTERDRSKTGTQGNRQRGQRNTIQPTLDAELSKADTKLVAKAKKSDISKMNEDSLKKLLDLPKGSLDGPTLSAITQSLLDRERVS
jgi:hypothetical protein